MTPIEYLSYRVEEPKPHVGRVHYGLLISPSVTRKSYTLNEGTTKKAILPSGYISLREAAEIFHIGQKTLRKHFSNPLLGIIKIPYSHGHGYAIAIPESASSFINSIKGRPKK